MDRPHWPQEIVVKPMEEILPPNTTNSSTNNNLSKPSSSSSSFERRVIRSQKAAAVNCPRCESTNTKFCYYNNYSLSQPRYFCKTCRRYWTEGGTLRNIPVGGGSRKNKRSSTAISASSSASSSVSTAAVLSQNPRIHHHDQYGQDLNLGFTSIHNFKNVSEFLQVPIFDATRNINSSVQNSFSPISIPNPNSVYTPLGQLVIPMPEFKIPPLGFSLDGMGSGDRGAYGTSVHESNDGRPLLFPFEELKTNTSTTHVDIPHDVQDKDQNCDSNGFWNGMMGGGSW